MSRVIREIVEAILLAGIVFFVIQISAQNFRVVGDSMKPTLRGDEYLMVNKLAYLRVDLERLSSLIPLWNVDTKEEKYLPFAHPPERGDVIVFHAPHTDKDFVKRVVGLPGERVEIRAGVVYINGEKLDEPELIEFDPSETWDCIRRLPFDCTLQSDDFFVLGDNREDSNDSRDWGSVPLENIVGKVWFVYWPFSDLPFLGSFFERAEGK